MEQSKSEKGTIAAITAAVAAYVEEEGTAPRVVMMQRRQAMSSSSWHASGREEMMWLRMLWQRRIVPK